MNAYYAILPAVALGLILAAGLGYCVYRRCKKRRAAAAQRAADPNLLHAQPSGMHIHSNPIHTASYAPHGEHPMPLTWAHPAVTQHWAQPPPPGSGMGHGVPSAAQLPTSTPSKGHVALGIPHHPSPPVESCHSSPAPSDCVSSTSQDATAAALTLPSGGHAV